MGSRKSTLQVLRTLMLGEDGAIETADVDFGELGGEGVSESDMSASCG